MAHSAVTGFLVKSIKIWSRLLWYWPKLYELFVILINAQFILSPHLLFPSVWQNLSEWKCKCFAIYILFSTRSIYWYKNISSGRHLEPARFYYGLGIGIFVIGPINHCNRWELTNKNLASYPTLPTFLHLQLSDFLYNSLKTQTNVFFSFPCLQTHVHCFIHYWRSNLKYNRGRYNAVRFIITNQVSTKIFNNFTLCSQ